MISIAERIIVAFILTFLLVIGIAQLGLIKVVVKKESLELHKCKEYIILSGDTVEVIYTKHEFRHFKMIGKTNK